MAEWVLGMSGASGALFGRRVLQALEESDGVSAVHLVVSASAAAVARQELQIGTEGSEEPTPAWVERLLGRPPRKIRAWSVSNTGAPVASGSYPSAGMAIVPCSMATVAAIANGLSTNLIHRAAEVMLKERRPLLLAFRESPLSAVHLENLARAARAGAILMPIMPPWYLRPRSIEEMVDQWTARVLHTLRVEHPLAGAHRYREER